VTSDPAVAARAARLRNGGQSERYLHAEFGVNSRLDEIQAAVLRARLPLLPRWTARRRALAAMYRSALRGVDTIAVPPELDPGHACHLFPVLSGAREAMRAHLLSAGVETLIHYPVPIPRQPALAGERPADCPVATRVCDEVFSLPLYPTLPEGSVLEIAQALASGPALDRAESQRGRREQA
jgi:dTDP-3-amino-3,4,6-trideoxy-alpha-D-glucose transaminase